MAFPVVPVLLALGAAGVGFYFWKKSPAQKQGAAAVESSDLPPDIKVLYKRLLTEAVNADAVDNVANKLSAYGYDAEADALHARAREMRAKAAPAPTPAVSPSIPIPTLPLIPGLPEIPGIPFFPPPSPSPPESPAAPTPQGESTVTRAQVTTHDPPPAGDLVIRDAPNGKQVGGADKDGEVDVLEWKTGDTGAWAKISWAGGRWPAVVGYAKIAYLSPVGYAQMSGSTLFGNAAVAVGCDSVKMRSQPTDGARQTGILGRSSTVNVRTVIGGWAFAETPGGSRGWVPEHSLSYKGAR